MGTALKLCFRAVLFILREIRLNNRWSQGLIMISAIRYRIYDIKMQGRKEGQYTWAADSCDNRQK